MHLSNAVLQREISAELDAFTMHASCLLLQLLAQLLNSGFGLVVTHPDKASALSMVVKAVFIVIPLLLFANDTLGD